MSHRFLKSRQPNKAPKGRRLTLECLETRELLSVSPQTKPPVIEETGDVNWFESVQNLERYTDDSLQGEAEQGDAWYDQWILQLDQRYLAKIGTVGQAAEFFFDKGITVLSGLGSPGLLLVQIDTETPSGQSEILAGLDAELDCLEFWQPNYFVTANGVAQEVNDPQVDLQWALDTIDVGSAWDASNGTGVVVAVLDSGITLTHPDLKNNIWINTAEISGDGVDNDGNGFVDDIYGWNFVANTSNVTDNDGHGTHVSGIIGATANNGIGGSGAAPGVQLLPLKVISGSSGSTASIVSAMNYLLDLKSRGVNIAAANMSLGYYSEDTAVLNAIARAADAGVVVVTSAGNDAKNNDNTSHYPSQYTTQLGNVIAVASIDKNGQLASNSNYGVHSVDLAAPGVSIYSTTKNGSYGYMSGTSMAAPFVTAAVAMLAASETDLTPGEIKAKILESTVSLASLTGKVATGGLLNLTGLFSAAEELPPKAPTDLTVIAIGGGKVSLQWRDNSSNEIRFEIQASTDAGQTWTTIAADVPANQTTYAATADSGTVYLYRVRSVNDVGGSAWSNFVSTVTEPLKKPAAPTNVKTKVTDHQEIVVTWKAVSGATAYRVERALSPGGDWQEVYFGTGLSLTDSGLNSSTKYYYRVYAVNISLLSSASSTVSATTAAVVPDTPTSIAASLVGPTTVGLTWNAAPHATSYRIEYYDATRDRWLTAGTSTTNAFSHRSLQASTAYRYRVTAVSKAGASAASDTVDITTPIAIPVKPTVFKGKVVDATTVQLSWNAVPGAASYRIEYSMTGKSKDWTTFEDGVTGTTATATGLAAGMKHYFRLIAVNESGDSKPSVAYAATTPALAPEGMPASVTVMAESATQVRVSWTAVKNATKYVVERSTNGTNWSKVKTISATDTEVLLAGHKATTVYYYRVTATSPSGSSNPSNTVAVTTRFQTPAVPRLTVVDGNAVRVAWNPINGADGYRIERAEEGSIVWNTVATLSGGVKEYVDDTCRTDTTYRYRIVAVSKTIGVDSAPSKEKSIRTAPATPQGISATEISSKQITLTWNETEGAVRYTVQGFDGKTWKNVGSTKTNEITIKSLKTETEYRFRIIAIGKDGSSKPGAEITAKTLIDVPATPGGTKTYAMDAGAVALTWKPAAGADSYSVYRYDSVTKTWRLIADSIKDTEYFDTNLSASTRYQYRIYATNVAGMSRRYASGNAVTLKASIGTVAPTNWTALSVAKNVVKLAFTPPEAGSQTYRLQWSVDGELWSSQKTFSTTQATAVVSGLKSGTTYYFRIRLEKGKNVSDWSDVFQVTTI